MDVLAIPGSLRKNSFNRRLLMAAADLAPAGTQIRMFDGLGGIPLFDEDLEQATGGEGNEAVRALRDRASSRTRSTGCPART